MPTPELISRFSKVQYVFFDVDGTLIDDRSSGGSVWAKIHSLAGIGDDIRNERCRRHREGEISYEEWMSLDIGDWQRSGLTRPQIEDILKELRLYEGVIETLEELNRRGYKLGVISSSIDIGILSLVPAKLFEELSINRLFFDEATKLITGWDTSACRLEGKGERLRFLSDQLGVNSDAIAFVGNDYNDVQAARFAGASIAVNCVSPELAEAVSWCEPDPDLRSILKLFKNISLERGHL